MRFHASYFWGILQMTTLGNSTNMYISQFIDSYNHNKTWKEVSRDSSTMIMWNSLDTLT